MSAETREMFRTEPERRGGWDPGVVFKDGKLLLFEARRLTLIRAWPEPQARARPADGHWRSVTPGLRLVAPYRGPGRGAARGRRGDAPGQLALRFPGGVALPRGSLAEQRRRALQAFRFALPRPVARGLERFQRDQFPLLQLAAASPGYVDLLTANPALAFGLAHHPRLRLHRMPAQAARLATRKQTEILEWLGFPATPAVARTLRKLEAESIQLEQLGQLRALLRRDEARRLLAHLPRINTGTLALVEDEALRAHAAPQLLEVVAADARERYRADTASRLRDTLALARELRPRQAIGPVRSRGQLEALHHELAQDYVRRRSSKILRYRFPAAPLPGADGIVALSSPAQLVEEGQLQHNCVASYARAVAAGDVFIYRILAPARATLAIRPDGRGRWSISELLGPCNQPAPRAVRLHVQRWLASQLPPH